MTIDEFLDLVERTPSIGRRPNIEQEACIRSDPANPTMIVAGPGSGKTTALVLRALRHMVVDRIPPEGIVITTFTTKAAREIRSRLIEWGEALLATGTAHAVPEADFLRQIDINRVVTGTLDSLCQEALGSDRYADEPPLVTVESFAAGVLLQRRAGFSNVYLANRAVLESFLTNFTVTQDPPRTVAEAAAAAIPIIDRLTHDQVDTDAFGGPHQLKAQRLLAEVAASYRAYLRENNLLDFPALEEALLKRLTDGRVPVLLSPARAVLVDEYQDTNALQEAIYFALTRATGASLTVVGDDDQSLYRFRGATIELFRAFVERCEKATGCRPVGPLYLVENYRSSQEIVSFFNDYIRNDPNFTPARISPPKPNIRSSQGPSGVPILAMFRSDSVELARDLTGFLHDVFRGDGYRDPDGCLTEPLRRNMNGGDLGDAVLLGHSVDEMARPFMGNEPRPRFLHYFRKAMADRNMRIFNPRGQSLRDIPEVQRLLGLALLAIDPPSRVDGPIFETMAITNMAKFFMQRWVQVARDFLDRGPQQVNRRHLASELNSWQAFVLQGSGERGHSRDWPFLDVLYSFVPWVPSFEDDPEGLVYLEAISRAAGQASGFSPFSGKLVRPVGASGGEVASRRSIEAILRDIFVPVAENEIAVDEEILPSVPRDRLNVMTIHQAKGLEYPLVIVDVGANFSRNAPQNLFRRFPERPSSTAFAEDLLAPFTGELGRLRQERTALERSFEDLIRLYYVAFSRPQSVLMLVGCDKMLRWKATIKHVGVGWRQDGSWAWRDRSPPWSGRRLPSRVRPHGIHFI